MGTKFNAISNEFDLVNDVSSLVTGPGVSTDNAVARFDSTTGKVIQNSGVIIDDSDQMSGVAQLTLDAGAAIDEFSTDGTLAGDSDALVPTQKAVKTYVDNTIPPREFPIDASAFHAVETNFAVLTKITGSNVKKFVRAFDKDTEQYANYKFFLPQDLSSSGTVTFRALVWASTAASSKNIALTFGHKALASAEDWDVAYTDVDSGDKAIDATQNSVTVVTWTETLANLGWVAGDFLQFRVSRDVSASSNLASDMYLDSFNLEVPVV